jgi:inorganic triphosphatase YgiF
MLMPGTTKIELKLRVPASVCAPLARHPALSATQAPETRRLNVIYFDTAANDLWRSGLALGVRRDGTSWTQTLKGAGTSAAGLHSRMELDAPAAKPAPDLALFAPGSWTDRLTATLRDKPLRRVFVTQVVRSARLLHRGSDTAIEASLDRGQVRAGRKHERLCELKLELKAGAPRALYELALELVGVFPIAVEQRSKTDRGYALHDDNRRAPVKGGRVALAASMTVSDALDATARAVLSHLQANDGGVLHDSDPEYVHQMRVALRRLRSALSVFRPVLDATSADATIAEVRWIARTLGAARDWDVFMDTAYPQVQAVFPAHAGVQAYERAFRKHRDIARCKAQRAVASSRYQRLVLELGAWLHGKDWCDSTDASVRDILQQPVTAYAEAVLEARYARLRKRGRNFKERSFEELHALRIAAKKVRYAAQFFAGLYDAKRAQALLTQLSGLQDALGALHDATAVHALVESASPTGSIEALAEAHGILVAWNRGQAPLLRREAERAWRSLRRCPTFW